MNSYGTLVGKRVRKRSLGRPRMRWHDNTKLDDREIDCEDGRRMELTEVLFHDGLW
jgi:hypothetical protein